MMTKTYDVLCMGRSTLDLFGATLNADFADQTAFNAYVGGSPTNICVAAQRLGLKSALLTGVGDNFVASFLKKFLNREGVAQYLIEKPGFQTNTVVVALQPPDEMQFVPYPFHNADLQLTIADVRNAPIADAGRHSRAGAAPQALVDRRSRAHPAGNVTKDVEPLSSECRSNRPPRHAASSRTIRRPPSRRTRNGSVPSSDTWHWT
jgi:sugar/nucleoside kinase (ribokinase family)